MLCSHLVRHQKNHVGKKPYTCKDCREIFTQLLVQRLHLCAKWFACSKSGKGFGQRTHLGRHWITCTWEKQFFCSEFGKGL
ncbi:hypothetical protein FKM82_021004 [Ascaphus truei]